MPKKNQIRFKDFHKAIVRFMRSSFADYKITQKSGSGIRYEYFLSKNQKSPIEMWVMHEDKYVHKGDLKKTCQKLKISVDEFMKFMED
ncbi:MAG: hypothetical protein V1690_03740 [Candidatus Moraniibacteriota bacterium]